jgi:hypothetical protein
VVAAGSGEVFVMVGGLTTSVNDFVVEFCVGVCESFAVTGKVKAPPVVGVPLNTPVLGLIDNQVGSPVAENINGATPPVVESG